MRIITIIKNARTRINTLISLRAVASYGKNIRVNKPSRFNSNTYIGDNCHFNGARITGNGKVTIGDNFHSGENLTIITGVHNYDGGLQLPYDNTYITKDVTISENVWIGLNVIVLGGGVNRRRCDYSSGKRCV